MQNGESHPCLIYASLSNFTKEAQNYMSVEGSVGVSAGGIMVDDIMTNIIVNFFLAVNKPKTPIKMFTKEKNALIWLEKYK